MTNREIRSLLNSIAPTYYSHAPIGTALPFITYLANHENNFGADNKVYQIITDVTITAYMTAEDLDIEDSINAALDDAGIYWTSSTDYDREQKLYTTIYEMEVI